MEQLLPSFDDEAWTRAAASLEEADAALGQARFAEADPNWHNPSRPLCVATRGNLLQKAGHVACFRSSVMTKSLWKTTLHALPCLLLGGAALATGACGGGVELPADVPG